MNSAVDTSGFHNDDYLDQISDYKLLNKALSLATRRDFFSTVLSLRASQTEYTLFSNTVRQTPFSQDDISHFPLHWPRFQSSWRREICTTEVRASLSKGRHLYGVIHYRYEAWFLTSVRGVGQRSALRLRHFTPQWKSPQYSRKRGWVGLTARLNATPKKTALLVKPWHQTVDGNSSDRRKRATSI